MRASRLLGLFKRQDATVANHKKAIRYHRKKLRLEAIKRDVLIDQLNQLGIIVEQGAEEKSHGQHS